MSKKGLLIVISGPSGSGKGTVLKKVMQQQSQIRFSVSATTRLPRAGEIDGKHYYFIDKNNFEQHINSNGLLEYTSYCDNYYGTLKAPVEAWRSEGYDVVLEIEVKGAEQVLSQCDDAVLIFITPPSFSELEKRLIDRKTEDMDVIEKRLQQAKNELKKINLYHYIVVNDSVEDACDEIVSIIKSEKCKVKNNKKFIQQITTE